MDLQDDIELELSDSSSMYADSDFLSSDMSYHEKQFKKNKEQFEQVAREETIMEYETKLNAKKIWKFHQQSQLANLNEQEARADDAKKQNQIYDVIDKRKQSKIQRQIIGHETKKYEKEYKLSSIETD